MPNQKQSNTRGILISCVSFMDAFCRRDLSLEEMEAISDIFNVACSAPLPPRQREELIINVLRKTPNIVKFAPVLSPTPLASPTGNSRRKS